MVEGMSEVTVTRVVKVGKRGAERTRHYLSNDWWIDEGGRPSEHRGHKFSLYKPTTGEDGTFVKSSNKLKRLLKYLNEEVSGLWLASTRPRYCEMDPVPFVVAGFVSFGA